MTDSLFSGSSIAFPQLNMVGELLGTNSQVSDWICTPDRPFGSVNVSNPVAIAQITPKVEAVYSASNNVFDYAMTTTPLGTANTTYQLYAKEAQTATDVVKLGGAIGLGVGLSPLLVLGGAILMLNSKSGQRAIKAVL